jgi:hypothetical protein
MLLGDLVASDAVLSDPEVASWLAREGIAPERVDAPVKDFEDHAPQIFRLQPGWHG